MSGLVTDCIEDLERALDLKAKGKFRALINQAMPLQRAEEPHCLAANNEPLGKIILAPVVK